MAKNKNQDRTAAIKATARTGARYWAEQLEQRVDRRDKRGIPCFEDAMAVFFEHMLNNPLNDACTLPISASDETGRFLQGAATLANIYADPRLVLPQGVFMWVLPGRVVISVDGGQSSRNLPLV